MKKIVWKAYFDFEKEERWLNDMAAKGFALTRYTWCRYEFEETPPGEYIYRIELLKEHARHPESRRYIDFIEETGAECVTSYLRWVYFRKKAALGPFELYSDLESRIGHYRRVRIFWLALLFAEISVSAGNARMALESPLSVFRLAVMGILLAFIVILSYLSIKMTVKIHGLERERRVTEG